MVSLIRLEKIPVSVYLFNTLNFDSINEPLTHQLFCALSAKSRAEQEEDFVHLPKRQNERPRLAS